MTSFRGVRRRTIPFLMATAVAPMAIVTIAPAAAQTGNGTAAQTLPGLDNFSLPPSQPTPHAEPDAGAGHRAVADPHGISARDADTARDPACHTDADAARYSDPDTAGNRIAYAGRHADRDSSADPDPDADADFHSIAHAG